MLRTYRDRLLALVGREGAEGRPGEVARGLLQCTRERENENGSLIDNG
jgi:hypothetical protein